MIHDLQFWGAPETAFAVYSRISTGPTNFNASVGRPLIADDGTIPTLTIHRMELCRGPLDTLVVSSGSGSQVYLNHVLGTPGIWTKIDTPESTFYTHSLRVMPNENDILIVGGGALGGTNNSVTAATTGVNPVAPSLAKCGGS